MKKLYSDSAPLRSSLLLLSLILAVFILPVIPGILQKTLFRVFYTFIYISAILSLDKRSKPMINFVAATILIEWISGILDMEVVLALAKLVNISFFFVIVILLIRQIAISKKVSTEIILDSVSGYLLIGVIFSILIIFIIQYDPESMSNIQSQGNESESYNNKSVPLYFSFVTLATLGYGDILPLKPYTRSLATLIVLTGQFYIAIIVALLVGKFASQKPGSEDD